MDLIGSKTHHNSETRSGRSNFSFSQHLNATRANCSARSCGQSPADESKTTTMLSFSIAHFTSFTIPGDISSNANPCLPWKWAIVIFAGKLFGPTSPIPTEQSSNHTTFSYNKNSWNIKF
uniref:Uncharacterized protein n=1 Tax=Cucumis melo TaxID=3656 RepID=A0A9I9ECC4_CUCME